MKLLTHLLILALLLSLSACGGGSSKSRSSSVPGDGGSDTGGGSGDGDGDDGNVTSFRISGLVRAERFSDTDSDSNDPAAPLASNDTANQAQPLGNPVVLGGFASATGSGKSGQRFSSTGDTDDWFSVSLSEGQRIRLTIHNHQTLSRDLDLFLHDADNPGTAGESSTSITDTETIRVPADGDYLLQVHAEAGISGYTLRIDSSDDRGGLLPLAQTGPSVGDDFIPGELIVKWKEKAAAGRLSAQSSNNLSKGPQLYRLGDASNNALSQPPLLSSLQRAHPRASAKTLQKLRTLMELKALQADAEVEYAEPNYRYHTLRAPNDPLYLRQWHYRNIHLPQAWDLTIGNDQTVVAVLDTGIFRQHPDFSNKLMDGYDFISDAASARDGDGIDPDPEDPGDQALGNRSSWHGTHVAGTVGAATNNTSGVSGAGWLTRIMPLRVLGADGGNTFDIAQAVLYAAGLDNESGTLPLRKADVINMSFGGPGLSQTLQSAINSARAEGVIVVAAAGNDNSSAETYPAAMSGVIAVGATDFNNAKAPYSNFGEWLDLAAPGGDMSVDANGDGFSDGVLSTYVQEGVENTASYGSLQGTSMASPHAAAVFALMRAVNPELSPGEVDVLLKQGRLTEDLGDEGHDPVYGHGLLDAYKAVEAASQGVTQPVISATPETLNFGEAEVVLKVEIENIGADGASVSGTPTTGASWITSVEQEVDTGSGFGIYRIEVLREGLENGVYNSEVIFPISGADNFHLPVNMQVGESTSEYYAGHLYILLLKPLNRIGEDGVEYETVAQVSLPGTDGNYPFSFDDVEPGEYAIGAGSDLNGNGFICDPGEACAIYPASGESSFVLNADRLGLELVASYSSSADTEVESSSATASRRPLRLMVPLKKMVQ